jgi:hypothetical protein
MEWAGELTTARQSRLDRPAYIAEAIAQRKGAVQDVVEIDDGAISDCIRILGPVVN